MHPPSVSSGGMVGVENLCAFYLKVVAGPVESSEYAMLILDIEK